MTTTDQQAVTVAQEDREAAAKLLETIDYVAASGASWVRDGHVDIGPTVQAFARHRLASVSSASAEPFLSQLRRVNLARYEAWVEGADAGIMFDALELGGEVGELLNIVKKLEREERGWRGSRANLADFDDECADVLICLDKLARRRNVDLATATIAKFNATSVKVGLPHRLSQPATSQEGEEKRARVKAVSNRLLARMREYARQGGWALAVHGSMTRDLDIVAVPWTDQASYEPALVEALRAAVAQELGGVAFVGAGEDGRTPGYKIKPNGRRCYTLHSTSEQLVEDETGAHPYVDLSILDFRLSAVGQAFGDGVYAACSAIENSDRGADDLIQSVWPDYADHYAALLPTPSGGLQEALDGKARERLQAYVDWAEAGEVRKCPGIVPDDVARLLAATPTPPTLNSWANTPEAEHERILLMAEIELHLKSCRIFLTTREKMHSVGVDIHDELLAKVTAAIEATGSEKANG